MKIDRIEVQPWDIPMYAPYRSAQRTTTVAHNILVTLFLESGVIGYGESAPARYVTEETPGSVLRAVNLAASRLVGETAPRAAELISENEHLIPAPGARSALEMALYDAMARAAGVPLYRLMGGDADSPVVRATDISIPLLPPGIVAERAADAASRGFRTLKLKVGGGDGEDAARVRAVADAAPDALLRLDGNQAFSAHSAVEFVEQVGELVPRIQLLEQPTRAGDDDALKFVQDHVPFPVFADESCHGAEDARRLLEAQACRGVVLKLAKSGLTGTYETACVAAEAGGLCLFGCMMESHIGIAAALHLTLALGESVVPLLDLDGHLLVDDRALVSGGPQQDGETMRVDPEQPGLGVSVRTVI
ncbi:MAG: dipeptide epimerase [Armatimonadaceae bacterium]